MFNICFSNSAINLMKCRDFLLNFSTLTPPPSSSSQVCLWTPKGWKVEWLLPNSGGEHWTYSAAAQCVNHWATICRIMNSKSKNFVNLNDESKICWTEIMIIHVTLKNNSFSIMWFSEKFSCNMLQNIIISQGLGQQISEDTKNIFFYSHVWNTQHT